MRPRLVEAAPALGGGDAVLLGRHTLPHLVSPVVVAFSLDVGARILITAGLSFLGLGTSRRRPTGAACWPRGGSS